MSEATPTAPPRSPSFWIGVVGSVLAVIGCFAFRPALPKDVEDPQRKEARRLVAVWADKLDRQTTDTGVYDRWPTDTLPDDDPWGRPLRVAYSQGGVAEDVTVLSLGPDGKEHTDDDVLAVRHAVNLKGVGEGIKKNAEETTHHAAKGLVRGLVDGAKESVRGERHAEKN
ncbi:type II secretion system protein GspG [Limnoglobus roseus]|uniref:Type II secretion system protein GspG C-terminal domain-containing protein n=1 Tax=Limnoglobus roseus TaxID=2598579 RepID=A0A5C1A3N1_9BACT|nr:type II secretion system protein GspG [Limnoglobus roseus]QEL13689.1 hypothetical protein PX52LOC_00547 [Limnoglobus roseus]